MWSKLFIQSTAIFFLVLFTGTKVIGVLKILHNHEHQTHNSTVKQFGLLGNLDKHYLANKHSNDQENEDDCGTCDKILLDYFNPYDKIAQITDDIDISEYLHMSIINEYNSENHSLELSLVLFSRPPPPLS